MYHLHGKTGRFTVGANGKQNSRLINFFPESRLPCALISYVTENGREMLKLVSKDGFEEMEHETRLSFALGNFPPKRPVFHLLSNRISKIVL